jgi:hypothetical protein
VGFYVGFSLALSNAKIALRPASPML